MGGIKNDQHKIRFDLLPVDALTEVARVFTFGANKYKDRNWEEGIRYHRCYGAILRHVFAWWHGEKKDEDSGLHPLAHVLCEALFLLHFELNPNHYENYVLDDRPHTEDSNANGISMVMEIIKKESGCDEMDKVCPHATINAPIWVPQK